MIHRPIIVVVATGEHPWMECTLPRLMRFARRCGADFHIAQSNRLDHRWPAATWLKLRLLPDFLHYSRIVIMDADMMPTANLTCDDIDALMCPLGVVMAPDHGMPTCNGRFTTWCHTHYGVTTKVCLPYYNAGLVSLPSALAAALALRVKESKPVEERFHDQDFINMVAQLDGWPVHALSIEMNWHAPQNRELTLKTAKIIHFSGHHKNLIADYHTLIP